MLPDAFGAFKHNFRESKEFRKSNLVTLGDRGTMLLILKLRLAQRAIMKLLKLFLILKLSPI